MWLFTPLPLDDNKKKNTNKHLTQLRHFSLITACSNPCLFHSCLAPNVKFSRILLIVRTPIYIWRTLYNVATEKRTYRAWQPAPRHFSPARKYRQSYCHGRLTNYTYNSFFLAFHFPKSVLLLGSLWGGPGRSWSWITDALLAEAATALSTCACQS